jgi:L-asparaginase / beta-aspartyl-peptidase
MSHVPLGGAQLVWSARWAVVAILLLAMTSLSAAGQAPGAAKGAESEGISKSLTAILTQQAADWNKGDIDSFMKSYWNSEDLTFSSDGKTARGWKATRERYLKGYPDRETMGKLTFSELEFFPLGDSAALVLGRWKLERKEPVGGNFSLVWRKIKGAWLIVHDHSSADAPRKE